MNESKVKYLIVGAYAVSLYAQPRATKDLDIFIKPDLANARAAFAALKKFGAPLGNLKPRDLIEPGKFFRMGVAPIMVDIFPEITGLDFDAAWKNREVAAVDGKNGLKANFISEEDLITAKIAVGRSQDLADVDALRTVKTGYKKTAKKRR
ncbi:MAG: hypothetical protein HY053_06375 [Proteobacteria bacterium]|nr:hypothetical protein [Pseudomonadota bacterium]